MCREFRLTCWTAAHDDRGAGPLAFYVECGAEGRGRSYGWMAGLREGEKAGGRKLNMDTDVRGWGAKRGSLKRGSRILLKLNLTWPSAKWETLQGVG